MNDDILWKIDSEINKDKRVVELTRKSEILEENNKLLIQQKYQMYEELEDAYERIDKAIECIKNRNTTKSKKERFMSGKTTLEKVLEILGDKENE